MFEHNKLDTDSAKKYRIVQKALHLGPGLKFEPTSEYEARLLELAIEDKREVKKPVIV